VRERVTTADAFDAILQRLGGFLRASVDTGNPVLWL
jgi:hypothetical protein